MKYFKNRNRNVLITILISIVCFFLFHESGVLDNAGMAAIVLNWLPVIIGLITIVIYLIANVFTKKYSWIMIILGNGFNIVSVVMAFLDT